jgi:hypothetical protein
LQTSLGQGKCLTLSSLNLTHWYSDLDWEINKKEYKINVLIEGVKLVLILPALTMRIQYKQFDGSKSLVGLEW